MEDEVRDQKNDNNIEHLRLEDDRREEEQNVQFVERTKEAVDRPPGDYAATTTTSNGHKRSLSGTFLSKLSFLRMTQATEGTTAHNNTPSHANYASPLVDRMGEDDDGDGEISSKFGGGIARSARGAMATALQHQRKMRRRRGSLRKTALLGTRFDGNKERRNGNNNSNNNHDNSGDNTSPLKDREIDYDNHPYDFKPPTNPTSADDSEMTPRNDVDSQNSSFRSLHWPRLIIKRPPWNPSSATVNSTTSQQHRRENSMSPVSPRVGGDEITTDDEDGMSLPRLNIPPIRNSSGSGSGGPSLPLSSLTIPTPSSSSDSYFPPLADSMASASRSVRATHRARSPLATHSPDMSLQESWDYSETEWWGWIILIVTWLVFVIGMGSSFGVWSWSWDVGETPYAPPELEDDPTLPIVGYYPALMVLTAVMAWVWVVVAWVGMKYFKHANISGDDR